MRLLSQHLPEVRERFDVVRLQLFGSTARDEASECSDVDVLVGFDGPATYDRYFGLKFFLEDLLGVRVELVSERALREELRPAILREAIHVA
jgi:predicted nucleotidyltransferase